MEDFIRVEVEAGVIGITGMVELKICIYSVVPVLKAFNWAIFSKPASTKGGQYV